MSGRARPWYRRGRSMWFFTDADGRQHPLGVTDPGDRAGAEGAMRELVERMAASVAARLAPPAPAAGGHPSPTVDAVAAAFLSHCEKKHRSGKLERETLVNYRRQIGAFARAFGPRPVGSLEPDEVVDWADRPGWSTSYQNATIGMVQTMLRHARVALPLKRPPRESRGADTVLTDEQFAEVLRVVRGKAFGPGTKGDLAELLTALRETGARPQEVARLTAEAVDWAACSARLRKHKTKKKTGRDRVLHFSAAAMAVLARQKLKYGGAGFLFRTRTGRPYSPEAIVRRMLDVSKKVGYRVTAYGLGRHSYATKALAAGIPDAIVAELLGHKGTGMLHFHYSHLGEQARVLKDAAERVSRRDAG